MAGNPESQSRPAAMDPPLITLFRHNLWANHRLLDACLVLNEQQRLATAGGTYGTIYDTLRHLVGAEQGYLIRLTGRQPEGRIQGEDHPDIAVLRELVQQSGEGLIAVAAGAGPNDVVMLTWDEVLWPVPVGYLLTQAINHATEHRAQVMTILTQQGIEPPDLSGWAYLEESVDRPTNE